MSEECAAALVAKDDSKVVHWRHHDRGTKQLAEKCQQNTMFFLVAITITAISVSPAYTKAQTQEWMGKGEPC